MSATCGAVFPWYRRGEEIVCGQPAGHADAEGLTRYDADTWHVARYPDGEGRAWTDRAHGGLGPRLLADGEEFVPVTREVIAELYGTTDTPEGRESREAMRRANRVRSGRDLSGRPVAILDGEQIADRGDWS